MKIFTFQAGLGNQLFQYAYYLYLKKQYPQEMFYGFYPERGLKGHNGLEIDKWFDVQLPETSSSAQLVATSLFWINKLFWKMQAPHPFTDTDWFRNPSAMFYSGYWQDKKYFESIKEPHFRKDLVVDDDNRRILELMDSTNSVAVHVRRGDYTNPDVKHIYGNICTAEYYAKAFREIEKRVDNPHYFFFSDDAAYVEEHFKSVEKTIINFNTGKKSFFDMYLMAHAKCMILANSTFSCWAAYLNDNNPLVVCPKKWRNDRPTPPVVRDNWVTIE